MTSVPTMFQIIKWRRNTTNLDVFGSNPDIALYLEIKDVRNLTYNPGTLSADHNLNVITEVIRYGMADSVTLSNVLDTIRKWRDRDAVLYYSKFLTKSKSPIYISIHEGDGSGKGQYVDGYYRANRPMYDYHDLIDNRLTIVECTSDYIKAISD